MQRQEGAHADQLSQCIGKFGLGQRNERGERLIQFAAQNNLAISNSFFQHHPRRLYTWTSPDGNYRNQIDYIMIGSRWKSFIRNVHTLPGADCGSDYQLLIAKVQLKLKATGKIESQKRSITQTVINWLRLTKNGISRLIQILDRNPRTNCGTN